MNDLIKMATVELERLLSESLPRLADEWWETRIIDRLSFQQQRFAQERHFKGLGDVDVAALLRVLDQNWYELSEAMSLPESSVPLTLRSEFCSLFRTVVLTERCA